jgi:heme/copper-type cytochrome/quinol oxidase subunit 3
MNSRPILDVSPLRTVAFGPQSLIWQGQLWMAVIEGTLFLVVIGAYFYIRLQFVHWPPPGNNVPPLGIPTLNVFLLLVSCIPMHIADKAVLKHEWRKVIWGTVFSLLLGFTYLGIRVVEWRKFNFAWDSNIYGSIVWLTLGLHTSHVIAALVETTILLFLVLIGKRDDRVRQALNVDELYWYFVVISGVLLYVVIFIGPRLT